MRVTTNYSFLEAGCLRFSVVNPYRTDSHHRFQCRLKIRIRAKIAENSPTLFLKDVIMGIRLPMFMIQSAIFIIVPEEFIDVLLVHKI